MVTIIVKIVTKLDVNIVIPKNIAHNIGSFSERDLALPARVSGVM